MFFRIFQVFFFAFFLQTQSVWAQAPFDIGDSDLSVGGDIFSDFNEDLEASQVFEDERFYRYGRFFSFNLGLGITDFTGNRGAAYTYDDHPSFHLSFNYFVNFQFSITLGVEYSKHTMIFDTFSKGYQDIQPGAIEIAMFRPFLGFRYYVDTTNLGTAITYSNPYFAFRGEYWRQSNKFVERKTLPTQRGGGIGAGIGFGLEFPVILKERYINIEFLWHSVNFFDRNDTDFKKVKSLPNKPSKYGYDDLTGNAWSIIISYNFTW